MKPSPDSEQLLAANQQLVLNMLRIQSESQTTEDSLKELARLASFDELTGLPNRRELRNRLHDAIGRAEHHGDSFSLLFLDLNDLKRINDTMGHQTGDALLIETAHRLRQCVQSHDTVARYGGDEFVILLTHCESRDDAFSVANQVILRLGIPKKLGERHLSISISVGISCYPEDGADPQSLIDKADAEMYRAKRGETSGTTPRTSSQQRMVHLCEANQALVISALDAQDLQQRAEATVRKDKLIYAMVVHELRTPLAPLSLSTEMLTQVDQKEMPRLHAIIGRQVEQLTRLVEDLVDVTRLSTGKLHLTRDTVDLSLVIQQAIDVCTPAIRAMHQIVELNLTPTAPYIEGDHSRLTQVLSNLLGNASKFSPKMGVIQLSLRVDGAWARIEVSDSGIGISEQALTNIFDPFVQDIHALSSNKKGLGIGLTVARELVEAHGGSIVAQSGGLGSGSCFIVRLPLSEQKAGENRPLEP